ncbi:hypothetical protein Tco_0195653 [Tanacetum coccineum]
MMEKGGAIALTRWIEKMESVFDNSGCDENQRVQFAASSFVNKALTWATILTYEAVSCGTLAKGKEKRKGVEETSKPGGSWKDNKKEKVGTSFVETAPPRNEFKPGHFAKVCRAPFKQVALVNDVRMGYNQRVCYECGSPDHLRNTYPKMHRAPRSARINGQKEYEVNNEAPFHMGTVSMLIAGGTEGAVQQVRTRKGHTTLQGIDTSIKITRAHTSEKTSTMLNEIESLKAQLRRKESCFTSDYVKPKVLAPGMEIVEEARVVKPLDNALNYACQYTKLSQELLEYVIGTCPKSFNERDNKAPSTPVTRKKQVTFSDKPGTSSSNTQKHDVHQKVQQTNVHVIHSTGVNTSTEASGSKPRSNTKKNRIMPAKSENKKKVEDHPRQ